MSESLNQEQPENLLPPSQSFELMRSYDEMSQETAQAIRSLALRGPVGVEDLANLEKNHGYRLPAFFYGTLLPSNVAENLVGGGVDGAVEAELPDHGVVAIERTTKAFGDEHFPAAYRDPESGQQAVKGFLFSFKESGPMKTDEGEKQVTYTERLRAICEYEEVSIDNKPGLYTLEIGEVTAFDGEGNEKSVPALYYHATQDLLEHRTQTDGEGKVDRYEDNVPVGLGDIATRTTVADWANYLERTGRS